MKKNNISEKTLQIYFYWVAIAIFTIVLLIRLFDLQILHQSKFSLQSEQNRVRKIPIPTIRGQIYDKNMNLLVRNKRAFSLTVTPIDLQNNLDLYDQISKYTGIEIDRLQTTVKNNMIGYFNPVKVLRDVEFELVSKFEEHRRDFPGVDFINESKRAYLEEINASHLFG